MIPIAKPILGEEEKDAVFRVMESGNVAQGPEVEKFENEYSELVNGRECIAVNSGTSALHLGLLAAGIGIGDEVIVPSFTFAATANAVSLTGAKPVFADIDPFTFCMDPDFVNSLVNSRTAALMPVHLYGHPADMEALNDIASRNGLGVFEDAAQAHLSEVGGKPVGCHGTFGAFSFYPTKNMTSGEGGMVVTEDSALAKKVRLLRNQGMEKKYENEIVGFNMRMTDIAAAIGRVQLKKLPEWTEKRIRNAKVLDGELEGVVTPRVFEGAKHVYHQYTIRVSDRDKMINKLSQAGVGYGIYYENPIHRLPSFNCEIELPETESAIMEVLSLPVHPSLSDVEIETVIKAVNQ
mgnify:CR=1 FL=1